MSDQIPKIRRGVRSCGWAKDRFDKTTLGAHLSRALATRDYEYVVYPSTVVSGDGVEVTGLGKKGLRAAVAVAKKNRGSGIYGISHGGFVGWVNYNGRYVPLGTEWGKLK